MTASRPEPSIERLQLVSAVVQSVFGREPRPVRVITYDGGVYTGVRLRNYYDEVVLGVPGSGDAIRLPLALVARLERYDLRLGRALLVGVAVLALGVASGFVWDSVHRDALRFHDGLGLGTIAGAMAAPFVVWLLQDAPGMKAWRTILDEQAA